MQNFSARTGISLAADSADGYQIPPGLPQSDFCLLMQNFGRCEMVPNSSAPALVDEPRHCPAVRHRLQLPERAEIPEKPLQIPARPHSEDRVEELHHFFGLPLVSPLGRHVCLLAC